MKDQPAFPCNFDTIEALMKFSGMTIRQLYKAAALTGICANADISKAAAEIGLFGKNFHPHIIAAACLLADAMLAEDLEHEKRESK